MATFTPDEVAAARRQVADLLDKVSTAPSIVHGEHQSGQAIGYAKALADLGLLTEDEWADSTGRRNTGLLYRL